MSVLVNPDIFREYDIRGLYPAQLNEDSFYILGRAISTFLKVNEIAVGYDMRNSSPSLFKSLAQGIIEAGVDVVNLGMISTEMNYFASGKFDFPANVIITASHNPAEYNGLKIVTRNVTPLHSGNGLPEIKQIALKNEFLNAGNKGTIRDQSIIDDWVTHVLKFVDNTKLKRFKIVIDAGNGMGGLVWEKLKSLLPITVIPLYFAPDGNFPHHLPDPLKKENLSDLKNEVIKQKADLGMALDGDADRIFMVDELGNQLTGTVTTAILASYLLQKYGASTILYNAVCGRIIPEIVNKYGGTPVRVRVGHSFIKELMKKLDGLFAGEHSGHFYFRDNFFADSSTIAGLIFLEYLSSENKPLSQLGAKYDKYKSSGEINYKVSEKIPPPSRSPYGHLEGVLTAANSSKLGIIKEIEKKFKKATLIDFIDGLSVWYLDWWFNLRASNTEPMIRLNVEADNSDLLKDKLEVLERAILDLGGIKV